VPGSGLFVLCEVTHAVQLVPDALAIAHQVGQFFRPGAFRSERGEAPDWFGMTLCSKVPGLHRFGLSTQPILTGWQSASTASSKVASTRMSLSS